MKQATLCFLVDSAGEKLLLGMKKRGFGAGKYNGYGGKPNDGESIEETAVRELYEEAGVTVRREDLEKVAELDFTFTYRAEWNQLVHVYVARVWEGHPAETEEMTAEWFPFLELPYHKMWNDDSIWLPLVLAGKKVKGSFVFGEDNETIANYYINEQN